MSSDLGRVGDKFTDFFELVSVALLLFEPDEASLSVVTALLYVFEGQETVGEGDFLEKLFRLHLADFVPVVHLRSDLDIFCYQRHGDDGDGDGDECFELFWAIQETQRYSPVC